MSIAAGKRRQKEMTADLLRGAAQHAEHVNLKNVLFKSDLPVDVRHNAKIHRLELGRWAAGQRVVLRADVGDDD